MDRGHRCFLSAARLRRTYRPWTLPEEVVLSEPLLLNSSNSRLKSYSEALLLWRCCDVAAGQNRFGTILGVSVSSPPILEPILVVGLVDVYFWEQFGFDPWPCFSWHVLLSPEWPEASGRRSGQSTPRRNGCARRIETKGEVYV